MALLPTLVAATGTLTSTGVFTDTQTITVGGKVYTSQTVLTNVDGNFFIGANQTASHLNLLRAINLGIAGDGTGAGTLYAAAMTANPGVRATSSDGTHTVVAAKVKGTLGNSIMSSETQTNASWGATALSGGTGDFLAAVALIQSEMQPNAQITTAVANLTNLG